MRTSSTNTTLLPQSSFSFSGGGSNRFLTIVPAADQTGSATVSVSVSDGSSTIASSFNLTVVRDDSYRLTPLWSTAPNAQPYFNTVGGRAGAPNQRTLGYNALSNHLYVVSREHDTSSNFTIAAVDADTGAFVYNLNTNGVDFIGQVGLVGIGVADDGAIYAANVDSAGDPTATNWKLYRRANGDSNTLPQLVFSGDPWGTGATYRWGDSIAVRGAGTNTQVIVDNREASVTPFVAIFHPTDSELTNFASSYLFTDNATGANIVARHIQFGVGNTFWQKRKGTPLVHSSYDLIGGSPSFSTTIGVCRRSRRVDFAREMELPLQTFARPHWSPDHSLFLRNSRLCCPSHFLKRIKLSSHLIKQ